MHGPLFQVLLYHERRIAEASQARKALVLPVAFSLTFRYGADRGLLTAKPFSGQNFPDLWLSDNTHPNRFNKSRYSGLLCYPSSSPQEDLEGARNSLRW